MRFPEVAFFHRRSKTLLVTDAVVFVDDTVRGTGGQAESEARREGRGAHFVIEQARKQVQQ